MLNSVIKICFHTYFAIFHSQFWVLLQFQNLFATKAFRGNNTGTFGVINDPAEDSTVFSTGYRGGKRFVDVVLSFTGTHSGTTPISVLAFNKLSVNKGLS